MFACTCAAHLFYAYVSVTVQHQFLVQITRKRKLNTRVVDEAVDQPQERMDLHDGDPFREYESLPPEEAERCPLVENRLRDMQSCSHRIRGSWARNIDVQPVSSSDDPHKNEEDEDEDDEEDNNIEVICVCMCVCVCMLITYACMQVGAFIKKEFPTGVFSGRVISWDYDLNNGMYLFLNFNSMPYTYTTYSVHIKHR